MRLSLTLLPFVLVTAQAAPHSISPRDDIKLAARDGALKTTVITVTVPAQTQVITVTLPKADPGSSTPSILGAIAVETGGRPGRPGGPKPTGGASPTITPAISPATTPATIPTTAPASPPAGNPIIGLAMEKLSDADVAKGLPNVNVPSFSGKVGWYYSWNTNRLPGTESLEFVPMIWGARSVNEIDKGLPEGTKHILGFNEPDMKKGLDGGSNQSPGEAAELHKQWTAKVPSGVKIGSPAVSDGGMQWLRDFNAACGGQCKYDFVPFHYYGTDAAGLIAHTKKMYAAFGKPMWLTEVACYTFTETGGQQCPEANTKAMMKTAIEWFRSEEGSKMVQRWSWFGAFSNQAHRGSNPLVDDKGNTNALGSITSACRVA